MNYPSSHLEHCEFTSLDTSAAIFWDTTELRLLRLSLRRLLLAVPSSLLGPRSGSPAAEVVLRETPAVDRAGVGGAICCLLATDGGPAGGAGAGVAGRLGAEAF